MPLRPENLQRYATLATATLMEVAKGKRGGKFITYGALMREMGGPGRGFIAEVLEEVCRRENQKGHPLLTALVIHETDKLPGYGFWCIGVLPPSVKNASEAEKRAFWREECERVWKYWQKHGL